LRELQEYLDGVRDELYRQSTEAKLISSREQRFLESPEDFDERIARENPVGAIPTLQAPEGSNYTNFESAKNDILFQTPRAIGPQRQIGTQQDSPDLPDSYINDPDRTDLGYTDLVAPNKGKALPYDDYAQLHYFKKKDMLLAYADAGIFNDMDAGFHQLINAIADGYDVPERAMDNEYRKFDKANSLFKGDVEFPDRGDRGTEDLYFGDIKKRLEKHREPEEESGFMWASEEQDPTYDPNERTRMGREDFNAPQPPDEPYPEDVPPPPPMSKKAKLNKFMIRERLMRGDYENYPDFKEVAELIVNTDRVEDEDINNFLQAFIKLQMQEEEEGGQMGGEDVNVGRPAEKSTASAIPLKSTASATANPIDFEEFQDKSRAEQYDYLQTLTNIPENLQANFAGVKARPKSQKKTMEYLYQQYLHYQPSPLTSSAIKELEGSSGKKASSASTEAEKYASPSRTAITGATEELGATPSTPFGRIHIPKSEKEFEGLTVGKQQAVLDRLFGEGFFEDENLDQDKAYEFIKAEQKQSWKSLFKRDYQNAFAFVFPVIERLRAEGTLGMGLPAPHHVLGPNGYGINGKPQGRPMMQTVGGSLHHTKSAPMGEWGGKLPTNKKKGNIIFGMGLARPTQPSPRMGKNVNLAGGIEAEPSYVKFGTHLINKHRLKDNVVMMRTMKGGAIVNIPTQKVSGKLAKVLHCISGGGIPQFESVMDLADDDKALLHRITKTSKVSDRLSVPNPNKTKMEEEDNRFNILRGEVSIGNDAPAVIKEFKVLLLKFMREGRVPTGQGKAIMEELLLMGY